MKILLFIISLIPSFSLAQIRIDSRRFGMAESEIRPLLEATLDLFPVLEGEKSPPLFISYHPEGPISLFERTPRGEIAIRLSSKERYHAQFIYQFAHELAHVRAKFQPAEHENKWLEETLCEAASLYALRELSRRWGQEAPSLSLKKYRLHLASYADKVLGTRRNLSRESASDFYQKHRQTLRRNSKKRGLNGALAKLILPYLEAHPQHWASLAHLPRQKGQSLSEYLDTWQKALPEKHHSFPAHLRSLLLSPP